jgi:cephalosporin hydroxylase
MNHHQKFKQECAERISLLGNDKKIAKVTNEWLSAVYDFKYSYHFEYLGRPIIQHPQDMVAMQELIWKVKPDLIIETGIAHGGSLIMNASLLALLDICDAIKSDSTINPKESRRKVLGVDIDIRQHNKIEIEKHPMASRIQMIEGASTAPETLEQVKKIAKNYNRILVCLDSNHTHEHVLSELQSYAPFTSVGSYCVVFDTIIEDLPKEKFGDRPWGPGNNPKTAVIEYLKTHNQFKIDKEINHKLLITASHDGYLKRVTE